MANDAEFDEGHELNRFVAVFATGKLIQFEMAVDLLKQAHIPYQTQEETGTGMKLSMPLVPTPGPGVFWNVLVPEKTLGEAKDVLSDLPFPITTDPGPWDFLPPATSEAARADKRSARWLWAGAFLSVTIGLTAYGFKMLADGRDRGDAIQSIVAGGLMTGAIVGLIWHSRRWAKKHAASDE